MNELEDDECS